MTTPDKELTFASSRVSRAIYTIGFGTLLVVLIAYTNQVLLLAFAGILLGATLSRGTDALASSLSIPRWSALLLLLGSLLILLGGGGWLLAPHVAEQSEHLINDLPGIWQNLTSGISGFAGSTVVDQISEQVTSPSRGTVRDVLGNFFGAVSGMIGFIGGMLVVMITALYLAFDPMAYRQGALKLFPVRHRQDAESIFDQLGETLWLWMIGKLMSMAVVGVLTLIGLWFLGVPLAITLSLIAALLTFIPNFGPIIAAVPAVLIGLGEGTETALYVTVLYVGVQTIESYAITPLIQQQTLSLPPALTIFAQLIMGVLAGGIGLAMATPLTAVGLVLVRELYVKEVSHKP